MSTLTDKYIDECIKNDITSRADICKKAQDRCNEIDGILREAELLRQEKDILLSVLREFKQNEAANIHNITPSSSRRDDLDEDNDASEQLRKDICAVLKKYGPLTNREIINLLLSNKKISINEDAQIIRNLKYLASKEIIKRDSERKIVPGPNWTEISNKEV